VRLLCGLTLVAFCVTLAGCGLTQRSRGTASRTSGGTQPFMGVPDAKDTETAGGTGGGADTLASTRGTAKGKGILAGQVLDPSRRRVPGAIIQVVELDAPRDGAAPLSVMTTKEGWFDVPGLEVGRWYRLVARARDGNRYLTGSTRVQCSNIRVAIALTGEEQIPASAPTASADTPARSEGGKTDPDKPASPAASLGGPVIKLPSEPTTTPLPADDKGAPPAAGVPTPAAPSAIVPPAGPRPTPGSDPSLLAAPSTKGKDGFIQRPPAANIEGPGRDAPLKKPLSPPYVAPPPGFDDRPLEPSSAPSAAPLPPGPAAVAPRPRAADDSPRPARLVVPSCVRIGDNRVEDFALYDLDGNTWELRKKVTSKTRLVLLDFWFTSCAPCRTALPFLVELDRKYRAYGLDIVGIAHEEGSFPEKQALVRQARTQYRLGYTLLFSGGDGCPVLRQLEVHEFPTVVLLDPTGKIVWRAKGCHPRTRYELENEIRRQLGLR
jgi:thiol-disulfide isomerase/thioredoxin